MANSFGRQVLTPQIGNDLMALANLDDVEWLPIGVTVDWDQVDAVAGTDVTLIDNTVVRVGQKALRYGQVMVKLTSGATAGMYAPFDSGGSLGQNAMTRDGFGIVNQTVLEKGVLPGLPTAATAHMGLFRGGLAHKVRIIMDSQTNELGGPAGPSQAALEAVATELQWLS